jgi:23S rRNA maturation-related 3'-5' exoribonuclease YhaM
MKHDEFKIELSYIKDDRIRKSCETILDMLPDYFYEIPASSTGKYHPSFSLGKGGLVRHVKVATRIANDLFEDPSFKSKYTRNEKDIMLMTLILHDSLKSGLNHDKYTAFNHPILISNFVNDNKDKIELTDEELKMFRECVESHMGGFPWNVNSYTNEELPEPKNKFQVFVHMCDYLSSRKYLDVKFNENNEIIDRD